MCHLEVAKNLINETVKKSSDFDCSYYFSELREIGQQEGLDDEVKKYISLVSDIACYHFVPNDKNEPYVAYIVMNTGRSAVPDDLIEKDCDLLVEICDSLESPLLQARINDVLWLKQRKVDSAKKAISLYLQCANETFDLKNWVGSSEYIERSLRLASLFRKKEPKLAEGVANILIGWIQENYKEDQLYLTAKSITLLLDFGYGDSKEMLNITSVPTLNRTNSTA